MPFTPLHMGPGLAIKAVAGPRFSLLAFGLAQVAMDIEPLLGMIRGAEVLHGVSHSYLAALLIALAVAAITPNLCRPILRRWNQELNHYGADWLIETENWSIWPVLGGALVGTLSHVALDSLMHADITPLAPWSDSNLLLGVVTIPQLHLFCIVSGGFGFVLWLALGLWQHKHSANADTCCKAKQPSE